MDKSRKMPIWYLAGPFDQYEQDVKALAKEAGLRIVDATATDSRDNAADINTLPEVNLKAGAAMAAAGFVPTAAQVIEASERLRARELEMDRQALGMADRAMEMNVKMASINERAAALDDREQSLAGRLASIEQREQAVAQREADAAAPRPAPATGKQPRPLSGKAGE